MTWVKLDDQFYDNPTNRALGPAGRDLFVAGLCYCNKGLTDGVIPKLDVPLVLAQAQAKQSVVKVLVTAGRWIDRGDHYEVDGYLTFQPSREKVLAERKAAASRQKSRRDRQRESRRESPRTNGVSHAHPDPSRPDVVGEVPQDFSLVDDQSGAPPCPEPAPGKALAVVPRRSSPAATGDVEAVFDAWREATGHRRAQLDDKRRRTIRKALSAYPLDDVIAAVRGWRHSPHHRGENDRRTVYNDLGLLLRDAAQIEKFRDLELGDAPTPASRQPKGFHGIAEALGGGG